MGGVLEKLETYKLLRYWAALLRWTPQSMSEHLEPKAASEAGSSNEVDYAELEQWTRVPLGDYRENIVGMIDLARGRGAGVIHSGAWVRPGIKVLVQNHGSQQRQVDVGVWLRQTPLAKSVKGVLYASAVLATLGGAWWIAAALGAAALGTEIFVAQHSAQLSRALLYETDSSLRSLPLDPLRSGVNGALED